MPQTIPAIDMWSPFVPSRGQSTIQDKILYGTGAFLLAMPPAQPLAEFRALPIRPEVMEKWLWRNAAALLRLPEASARAG